MTTPIAYTVKNAEKASGIPRTGLYEEMKIGRLKAYKRGKRTLICHESLTQLVASLPRYKVGA
jgi:hypothetical protein